MKTVFYLLTIVSSATLIMSYLNGADIEVTNRLFVSSMLLLIVAQTADSNG